METHMSTADRKQIATDFLRLGHAGDRAVIEHSHVKPKPGDAGVAVVHIFRFEGDRIAELWDVGQPVPAENPNSDGMF
jgi:predicted SnoaL-like aldol condensation-catalyzing enzyme